MKLKTLFTDLFYLINCRVSLSDPISIVVRPIKTYRLYVDCPTNSFTECTKDLKKEP